MASISPGVFFFFILNPRFFEQIGHKISAPDAFLIIWYYIPLRVLLS